MSGDRAWTRPSGLTVVGALATWALWKMDRDCPCRAASRGRARDVAPRGRRSSSSVRDRSRPARSRRRRVCDPSRRRSERCARVGRGRGRSRIVAAPRAAHASPAGGAAAAITITIASAVPAARKDAESEPTAPVMQMVGPAATPSHRSCVRDRRTAGSASCRLGSDDHTVAPGDTFWSIAEDAPRRRQRHPIDGDRARTGDRSSTEPRSAPRPDEPDLIFPGQVFVLPPLS